jgi:predicted transposase YdaD
MEEIGSMLNLGDYKKSRAYKETWEEASEATRQATLLEVMGKMAKQGLTAEDIATTLEMELAEVKKVLKKKSKK